MYYVKQNRLCINFGYGIIILCLVLALFSRCASSVPPRMDPQACECYRAGNTIEYMTQYPFSGSDPAVYFPSQPSVLILL